MELSASSPSSGLNDLSPDTLMSLADSYYVDENYDDAVDAYAAALSLFRETEFAIRIRALSHRSAAFYKLKRYEEALEDAQSSLEILSQKKPSGLRIGEGEICHRRAGLAAMELKRFAEAKKSLQMAEQLASLNDKLTNQYVSLIQECDAKLTPPKQQAENNAASAVDPSLVTPSAKVENKSSSSAVSSPTRDVKKGTDSAPAAFISPMASSSKSTAVIRPAVPKNSVSSPKYQYYQSDKVMTISILEAGVRAEDLTVRFEPKHLVVILRKGETDFTVIAGNLHSEIDVEKSKVVIKAEKILLKLRKIDAFEWHELLGKADDSNKKATHVKVSEQSKKDVKDINNNSSDDTTASSPKIAPVSNDTNKARPYAGHRDWDAIERNIIEEEKKEKPEGDEAMNKLFKQIYADASEDTRRAMVKSFQTSGGTVLSTNWDEVKKKDYEKERTGM
ncbi:MAG: HSP20 family molecular chaperone IbpA [Bacillariaceae sp.]|jgi:suppressor of G2 allele of SKP1